MTIKEIQKIIKVKLETEEYQNFDDNEIIMNLMHTYQTKLRLDKLGFDNKLTND